MIPPPVSIEEFEIPAVDNNIHLYLRNKHPRGLREFSAERTILCIHGATYPGHVMYDVPLDGLSWMDYMAQGGYDVYVLDIRGFGRSTRPPEMNQDPEANEAIVDSGTAVNDIAAAVDFILQRRGISSLNLIGWCWGTCLVNTYAIQYPGKVERIVLVGPAWFYVPQRPSPYPGKIPAYRLARRDRALDRWFAGVPEHKREEILPPSWATAFLDATWSSDPEGSKAETPYIRAPNGFLMDSRLYWEQGKSYYDPAKITVPILLVLAEWDAETPPYMAQTLFSLLVNSPDRRVICFSEGTHLAPLEKGRMRIFATVQAFLDEGGASMQDRGDRSRPGIRSGSALHV